MSQRKSSTLLFDSSLNGATCLRGKFIYIRQIYYRNHPWLHIYILICWWVNFLTLSEKVSENIDPIKKYTVIWKIGPIFESFPSSSQWPLRSRKMFLWKTMLRRIRGRSVEPRTHSPKKSVDDHPKLKDFKTLMERKSFEGSDRSSRRGVVISHRCDQMQSLLIQPDTCDVYEFRITVQSHIWYDGDNIMEILWWR